MLDIAGIIFGDNVDTDGDLEITTDDEFLWISRDDAKKIIGFLEDKFDIKRGPIK